MVSFSRPLLYQCVDAAFLLVSSGGGCPPAFPVALHFRPIEPPCNAQVSGRRLFLCLSPPPFQPLKAPLSPATNLVLKAKDFPLPWFSYIFLPGLFFPPNWSLYALFLAHSMESVPPLAAALGLTRFRILIFRSFHFLPPLARLDVRGPPRSFRSIRDGPPVLPWSSPCDQ